MAEHPVRGGYPQAPVPPEGGIQVAADHPLAIPQPADDAGESSDAPVADAAPAFDLDAYAASLPADLSEDVAEALIERVDSLKRARDKHAQRSQAKVATRADAKISERDGEIAALRAQWEQERQQAEALRQRQAEAEAAAARVRELRQKARGGDYDAREEYLAAKLDADEKADLLDALKQDEGLRGHFAAQAIQHVMGDTLDPSLWDVDEATVRTIAAQAPTLKDLTRELRAAAANAAVERFKATELPKLLDAARASAADQRRSAMPQVDRGASEPGNGRATGGDGSGMTFETYRHLLTTNPTDPRLTKLRPAEIDALTAEYYARA